MSGMIGIDTNIVVRILVNDDQEQAEKSRQLFAKNLVFISNTVILETEWVLRYSYELPKIDICNSLVKLFGLPNVYLESETVVNRAVEWCLNGLDFADALTPGICRNF